MSLWTKAFKPSSSKPDDLSERSCQNGLHWNEKNHFCAALSSVNGTNGSNGNLCPTSLLDNNFH